MTLPHGVVGWSAYVIVVLSDHRHLFFIIEKNCSDKT